MKELRPYEMLGAAIVERAILDYEEAIRKKITLEMELECINSEIKELDSWFQSEWFLDITCDKINPGFIKRKVAEKMVAISKEPCRTKYIFVKENI